MVPLISRPIHPSTNAFPPAGMPCDRVISWLMLALHAIVRVQFRHVLRREPVEKCQMPVAFHKLINKFFEITQLGVVAEFDLLENRSALIFLLIHNSINAE